MIIQHFFNNEREKGFLKNSFNVFLCEFPSKSHFSNGLLSFTSDPQQNKCPITYDLPPQCGTIMTGRQILSSIRCSSVSSCIQTVHREPAAAAVLSGCGPVHPDSPQPSGSSGPGGAAGVSPGDGSAAAGPPALPPRPADPTLAGPGRPHPQTVQHPGASPGAIRPGSTTLPAGNSFSLSGWS